MPRHTKEALESLRAIPLFSGVKGEDLERIADQHASSLSFQRVKERTQGLLQRLAKDECGREGRRITPVVTHQQIADMVGTSRETVTRALKGLKQEGWLAQEGKRYVVPV